MTGVQTCALPIFQAGCEAAFPWQKKGTAYSEMPFTDEHREAYENSAMPEVVDVQNIVDM